MILNKTINETYRPLVPYMPANPKVGYGYVPYQITPAPYSHNTRREVQ